MKKSLLVFSLAAALTVPAGARPPATPAASEGLTADSIMRRIDSRNPTLTTFQTRVHVNLRMVSFPWFYSKLDGTEYYKRPDKHGVIFDRAPSYAHGINSFFGAIDAPTEWRKDSNVVYTGEQAVDGKSLLTLRMTKKIYSDQVKDTVAYIDPQTYQVVRMDFNYTNGDGIVMTQTYKPQGQYSLVAARHLEIKRRVRAVANASYDSYQTNVVISDAVFETKK